MTTTYGENLITNGTFDTNLTGWTYSAGWSISGGKATCVTSPIANKWLVQTLVSLSANSEFEITLTTQANTSNNRMHLHLGSEIYSVVSLTTQTGDLTSHTFVVKPLGGNNTFRFEWGNLNANSTIYVDDIVIREIISPVTRLTKSRGFYGSNHGFYRK